MLVGLPRCFGRPELCRAYLLSSGEFLNYIEDRRNKESADEGLCHHATDHGRTDNLARDGARSGCCPEWHAPDNEGERDRKSTRLNSSHLGISYAVFCLKKKKQE